jgi:hypothetical protein
MHTTPKTREIPAATVTGRSAEAPRPPQGSAGSGAFLPLVPSAPDAPEAPGQPEKPEQNEEPDVPDDHDRPFTVDHRRLGETPAGFTPSARLAVSTALRTCGLIAALDDQQARTLLALLSCLSPNGELRAASFQVADVLGMSEREARSRLDRLAQATWREGPVVLRVEQGLFLPAYSVSPCLVGHEHPEPETQVKVLPIPTAGREAAVAASRAAYAVPRAEAEAAVAEQLGIPACADTDTPEGEAWRGLQDAGVPKDLAKELVEEFPAEEILRQLAWLPERGARDPARFIVAAIREGYAAPVSVRLSGRKIGYDAEEAEGKPLEGGADA